MTTSIHPLPVLALLDCADDALVDGVVAGYTAGRLVRSEPPLDQTDVGFGKARFPTALPPHLAVAGNRVGTVVNVPSKGQMGDRDASPIVAAVSHKEAVWNSPVCLFPRESVSAHSPAPKAEHPITVRVVCGFPFDASAFARGSVECKGAIDATKERITTSSPINGTTSAANLFHFCTLTMGGPCVN